MFCFLKTLVFGQFNCYPVSTLSIPQGPQGRALGDVVKDACGLRGLLLLRSPGPVPLSLASVTVLALLGAGMWSVVGRASLQVLTEALGHQEEVFLPPEGQCPCGEGPRLPRRAARQLVSRNTSPDSDFFSLQ